MPGILTAQQVTELCQERSLEPEELLNHLLEWGKDFALPPVSNYRVGAAALGESGRIYIGFNIEFENGALHHTVHAEQTLVALALNQGETRLVAMSVSAAPCGHCRQFLSEVYECRRTLITILNQGKMSLSELLPHPFGPEDLDLHVRLLQSPRWNLELANCDALMTAALEAAAISYAPYSNCPAGVALETSSGQVFVGSYAENAAFNPSLHPMQAALTHMIAFHQDPRTIARAVLVQADGKVCLEKATRSVLESIVPRVSLEFHPARLLA